MHRVALVVHESAMLLETALAAEVFAVDRSELSPTGSWYDVVAVTPDGLPHAWLPGLASAAYDDLEEMDTIVVSSTSQPLAEPDPRLLDGLRGAHDRGRRIVGLCTGAFVLAAAGLLDGRVATTHWMHAPELARRHPQVDVRADVLYVDEGLVLTSAGKTAALDLCLALVRQDLGAVTGNGVARRLVAPAHRPGGQAQFIAPPALPRSDTDLSATLEWARGHLDQPLTVERLARRAGLSRRQLARRMHAEVGTGPLEWIHRERLFLARQLLEMSDASVEHVAARAGLGSAATLRRHFHQSLGVTPTAYRTTFRTG
ncbi:helix-turn-helix domain-containing protein [Terrabacter lapilli]|uniref:Helix-turn-helix domain-containing protein n=1 Tax=Terrabacter lapilli TaxID=436231 RepID=A0ABP5D855_9MICO